MKCNVGLYDGMLHFRTMQRMHKTKVEGIGLLTDQAQIFVTLSPPKN